MARSPDPQVRRRWQRLLDSFDPDTTTVAEFCRRRQISEASFYQWRRRLRQEPADQSSGAHAKPVFWNVKVDAPAESAARRGSRASIQWPGGVRVDFPADDPRLLVAAIRALDGDDAPEARP